MCAVQKPAKDLGRRRLPFNANVSIASGAATRVEAFEEYQWRWFGTVPKQRVIESERCTCGSCSLTVLEHLNMEMCAECGKVRERRDATVQTSACGQTADGGPSHTWRLFYYERSSYLEHLLRQLSARGNTKVPEDVIGAVRDDLRARDQQITVTNVESSMRRLTRARNALRRKGTKAEKSLQPYYKMASLIASKINGKDALRLKRKVETEIIERFQSASHAFDNIPQDQKRNRVNMLGYSFVLRRISHHMCENHPEMAEFARLLPVQGRGRTQYNEELWRKICAQLKWRDNSRVPDNPDKW